LKKKDPFSKKTPGEKREKGVQRETPVKPVKSPYNPKKRW